MVYKVKVENRTHENNGHFLAENRLFFLISDI